MNGMDWTALVADARDFAMPELILTAFGCLALVLDVVLPRRSHRLVAYAVLVGAALAFVSVVVAWVAGEGGMPRYGFFEMVVLDEFALVFKGIVLVALAMSIALSIRFLDIEAEQRGEFYALMCFATVGMLFLACGYDLLSLYVSLELMSLSVYVLVGYLKSSRASNEAALKYFLLGAFSSGVLLYGMSLLYGLTGTTNIGRIAATLPSVVGAGEGDARYLLLVTVVLLAAGMCFKVAAVPFHMWAPDAYEGAPTPVTAFMSVGVKAASFALFARLFLEAMPSLRSLDGPAGDSLPGWGLVIGLVAAVTMTWGNLGALTQRNAKRLLAYSSISHAGYLLLGLLAGNEAGYTGLVVYLIVYVFMNLGAFGVLIALHRRGIEGDRLEDFDGLAQRAPGLAALMTIFLLSLGGIPPMAGFIGKFYLFYGLVDTGDPWLVRLALLALLNTAVSAYYYLQFVKAMYMGEADEASPAYETSGGVWVAVAVAAVLTVGIGVYPQPALRISKRAIERVKPAPTRTVAAEPSRRGG